MSYYDHASLIAHRLGPWQPQPGPPQTPTTGAVLPCVSKGLLARAAHRVRQWLRELTNRSPLLAGRQ